MTGLASKTWTYRQSSGCTELRLSTTALREGGVYHFLMIAGKGGRANIELDEKAISALATAIAAIEKNPARVNEFAINKTLSLTCEPPGFVLRNCAASHKFPAFEHLNALWERLREAALIAQLTERS